MPNCPIAGQLSVQLSNGWSAECLTVQWSDSAQSNCPMAGQLSFQLSNGWLAECPAVQWLDSAVSNCPMRCNALQCIELVGECCVSISPFLRRLKSKLLQFHSFFPAKCCTISHFLGGLKILFYRTV